MPITLLLVDDHQIFREALRSLIDGLEDMEIVGEAQDGREAVRLAEHLKPQVVLMDIVMPRLNGIEATRQIVTRIPSVKVLVLSMLTHRRKVIEALRAGASGYLLKDCDAKEVCEAILAVADGKSYVSPTIGDIPLEESKMGKQPGGPQTLTARERQVLQLLAEGHSTLETAEQLFVSPKTIENHRANTIKKLDLRNLADLTRYALREGLTSLDN